MFKFWNKTKTVAIDQYPSIKVGVQVGDIMVVADTAENLERLVKMMQPSVEENKDE